MTTPPRDGLGRYLIPEIEGQKPQPYSRATTVVKAIDDQQALISWTARMTALGLARRTDLMQMAMTADPEDRATLTEICDLAFEAGGGTVKRNIGTALHAAMEIINRGGDPLPFYAETTDAYVRELDRLGLAPVEGMVERTVVCTSLQIAGTFDLALTDGERTYVADYKTGNVEYPTTIAAQLAIYANADAMLSEDYTELVDPPGFDRTTGLVIEIPLGKPPVTIHKIDLDWGWHGVELAVSVRNHRKSPKSRIQPWT